MDPSMLFFQNFPAHDNKKAHGIFHAPFEGLFDFFYRMTSIPPIYILSASGMFSDPSALRLFSKKAMSIRGGATTVLFRVWAK